MGFSIFRQCYAAVKEDGLLCCKAIFFWMRKIQTWHKEGKGKEILFISGDVQKYEIFFVLTASRLSSWCSCFLAYRTFQHFHFLCSKPRIQSKNLPNSKPTTKTFPLVMSVFLVFHSKFSKNIKIQGKKSYLIQFWSKIFQIQLSFFIPKYTSISSSHCLMNIYIQ